MLLPTERKVSATGRTRRLGLRGGPFRHSFRIAVSYSWSVILFAGERSISQTTGNRSRHRRSRLRLGRKQRRRSELGRPRAHFRADASALPAEQARCVADELRGRMAARRRLRRKLASRRVPQEASQHAAALQVEARPLHDLRSLCRELVRCRRVGGHGEEPGLDGCKVRAREGRIDRAQGNRPPDGEAVVPATAKGAAAGHRPDGRTRRCRP